MPRTRSDRVEDIKALLVRRLADGHYRPGERFLSNRAVSSRYGLSYQTADRLIREICAEGYLERRAASGTYLPGKTVSRPGVCLCFRARARLTESFGARLLQEMTFRLTREGIPFLVVYDDDPPQEFPENWYPVLWEWGSRRAPHEGLLLHRRPASGMDSANWDSVSVDHFSGGACAAQVLRNHVRRGSKWIVVSGPPDDYRSKARVAGFRSILKADVVPAGWTAEDGEQVGQTVFGLNPSGIFCANDRIAEGLLRFSAHAGLPPAPIVGFDDAPIAEKLGITTIAIPWDELTQAAMNTVRQRLADHRGSGTHQVVAPRPVIRW